MLTIVITILLSFIIIWILHSLWNYIKDSYSPKKTRDLVGSQTRKYQKMIDEILKTKSQEISDEDKQILSNDLSEYMDEQLATLREI
jgi:uncharacterized protein YeeX (DUF496 family)